MKTILRALRSVLAQIDAEARAETACATTLAETNYPAGYIARRRATAARLQRAADHIRRALDEIA